MENDDYEIVTPQEFINGIVEKVLEEHAEEISEINDNIDELDIRLEDLDDKVFNNSMKIVEMNEILKEISEIKQLINNTERNRINTTLEAKLIRDLQQKNTELDKKITLINHIIVFIFLLLLQHSVAMLLVF